jgi:hypothetical protein
MASRTLQTGGISLGSLTLPSLEAGDFVELILPFLLVATVILDIGFVGSYTTVSFFLTTLRSWYQWRTKEFFRVGGEGFNKFS